MFTPEVLYGTHFLVFKDLSSIEHDLGLPPTDPYVLHTIGGLRIGDHNKCV